MTMPHVTVPQPVGAAARPSSAQTGDHLVARPPTSQRTRSIRELTPFVFLAMILIPSLIVLGLAIADPGAKSTDPSGVPVATATPGP